jgi:putative ABC transport system ATP-binding protein
VKAGARSYDWGCTLQGLHIRRLDGGGNTTFELSVKDDLKIAAGAGGVSLLPVMGRSGAGKSTLMNVLSATSFPAPAEARVHWRFPNGDEFEWLGNGRASAPLHVVRGRYFGYAFQSASLLAHLTVKENLVLGRLNAGDSSAGALMRAKELLLPAFGGRESEVDRIISLFPAQLSGGEKQRVALLNAVVRDPFVLFADEPTGSLDRATRTEVMRLLRDWVLARPHERLLIWVTHHDRDPVDNGTDRRLWVSDGTIRYEETPDGELWVPCPEFAA